MRSDADRIAVSQAPPSASVPALAAGFASIYLIWGSTYLAIRYAVETLPPFLMGGMRFAVAGFILWLIVRWQRAPRPNFAQWRSAAVAGTLMLAGGNGLVCWAEQWVPSSIAALIVGTVPLWMVLLEWLLHRGKRPTLAVVIGLAVGFAGVALLAANGGTGGDQAMSSAVRWGAGALLLACVFWSLGSLHSRRASQGQSMLQASAMQMLGGGAAMLIIAAVIGELNHFDLASISSRSAFSFAYLVLAGSLIGYTSYIWLLRVASPTAVSTYAYVNPIVAVALGWWLGNETITSRMLLAGAMVVGAVALMTRRTRAPIALKST
jgi:drug/metabolite transporter (DMT)-like permease